VIRPRRLPALVLAVAGLSALAAAPARAQYVGTTPKGQITEAATACGGSATYCGPQVLDPNSDGFVSATTAGFTLAPGFVGLMQMNVLIPDVPPGEQSFDVSIGDVAAATTTISIGPKQ